MPGVPSLLDAPTALLRNPTQVRQLVKKRNEALLIRCRDRDVEGDAISGSGNPVDVGKLPHEGELAELTFGMKELRSAPVLHHDGFGGRWESASSTTWRLRASTRHPCDLPIYEHRVSFAPEHANKIAIPSGRLLQFLARYEQDGPLWFRLDTVNSSLREARIAHEQAEYRCRGLLQPVFQRLHLPNPGLACPPLRFHQVRLFPHGGQQVDLASASGPRAPGYGEVGLAEQRSDECLKLVGTPFRAVHGLQPCPFLTDGVVVSHSGIVPPVVTAMPCCGHEPRVATPRGRVDRATTVPGWRSRPGVGTQLPIYPQLSSQIWSW